MPPAGGPRISERPQRRTASAALPVGSAVASVVGIALQQRDDVRHPDPHLGEAAAHLGLERVHPAGEPGVEFIDAAGEPRVHPCDPIFEGGQPELDGRHPALQPIEPGAVLHLGVAQRLEEPALRPQLAAYVADVAIGPARQRPGRLGVLPSAVQIALDARDLLLQRAEPPLEVAGIGHARRVRRPPAAGWAFRRTGTLEDMCGRYASIKAPADLADEFHAVDATEGVEPDYNVAPTKNIVAVVERHPRDAEGTPDPDTVERSLRVVKWGLVPYWAKDPKGGARMINARSESAAEKPAFRRALASRRCLIPADGWYEWQRGEDHKQPYYTHYADGRSLALAGLWEYWKPKDEAADPAGRYA